MNTRLAVLAIALTVTPAGAHRLDEYLQGTLVSIEKDRLEAEIALTPGVAVFPIVLADIDTNGDGAISEAEQQAYADRMLRDVSLSIDGHPLRPRLVSWNFSGIEEMKEGLGEIRIGIRAYLPAGGPKRRVVFENRHERRIAAYQVNCLVPRDPEIRVVAQKRNYTQSVYELEYAQAGRGFGWPADRVWLGAVALGLFGRFAVMWRARQAG